MAETVLAQVAKVIAETFTDNSIIVTRETVAEDVAGWDSLSHTILILALEDAFDIIFPVNTQSFANVGVLVDNISALLKK